MKKQTSVVAIVIAVVMSILLFPLILGTGIASGAIFSAESVVQPGREQELYDAFVENGGVDWIYDLFLEETGETMKIDGDLTINMREMFPKEDIGTLIKEIYQSFMKGERYSVKLPNQEQFMKQELMRYFDDNAERWLREKLGEAYDLADATTRTEVLTEVREEYEQEIKNLVTEKIDVLEAELTGILWDFYETKEYRELREIEAKYGYSLTDRTELCAVLNLAGYIVLGICCFFLVLLLICHLFRPSGFITAGVFTLITGGLMKIGGTVLPNFIRSLLREKATEGEELPVFILQPVEDVISWCMSGFDKVGMLGLSAGVILVLVGILLLIIRGNRTVAA